MPDPLSQQTTALRYICDRCGFTADIEPRFLVPGVIEYPKPVCLADNLVMRPIPTDNHA